MRLPKPKKLQHRKTTLTKSQLLQLSNQLSLLPQYPIIQKKLKKRKIKRVANQTLKGKGFIQDVINRWFSTAKKTEPEINPEETQKLKEVLEEFEKRGIDVNDLKIPTFDPNDEEQTRKNVSEALFGNPVSFSFKNITPDDVQQKLIEEEKKKSGDTLLQLIQKGITANGKFIWEEAIKPHITPFVSFVTSVIEASKFLAGTVAAVGAFFTAHPVIAAVGAMIGLLIAYYIVTHPIEVIIFIIKALKALFLLIFRGIKYLIKAFVWLIKQSVKFFKKFGKEQAADEMELVGNALDAISNQSSGVLSEIQSQVENEITDLRDDLRTITTPQIKSEIVKRAEDETSETVQQPTKRYNIPQPSLKRSRLQMETETYDKDTLLDLVNEQIKLLEQMKQNLERQKRILSI